MLLVLLTVMELAVVWVCCELVEMRDWERDGTTIRFGEANNFDFLLLLRRSGDADCRKSPLLTLFSGEEGDF